MTILDRYLFRRFLVMLALWFLVLVGIFVVFDLFTNFDGFARGDAGKSPWIVFATFYFYKSLLFVDLIFSLLVPLAALSVLATMIRHNEIITLMALGVSQTRILIPILMAGVVLMLGALYTREIYLPRHSVELTKTPSQLANDSGYVPVRRKTDAWSGIGFDGEAIAVDSKTIRNPRLIFPARFNPLPSRELAGTSAVWQPAEGRFPDGWRLSGIVGGESWSLAKSMAVDGTEWSRTESSESSDAKSPGRAPVLFTHADSPELLRTDECFVASGLSPEILALGDSWPLFASTPELLHGVKSPSLDFNQGDMLVRIHTRILRPLADLLPLLLGLPMLFLKSERNVFAGIALGMILGGLYIGVSYGAIFLGMRFGRPILAAWLPMFLFFPIVVDAWYSLRKNG